MNQAIRPEVSKLVIEVKSRSGSEHIENALEYNECIRDAWTELWVNNAYRNAPKIIEIFKTRAADMSFIERKDIEPYWDTVGISAIELYKDKRNLPVLKTIGLTDEDIQTLFNAFPNLNTIKDQRLIKMLPAVLNFFGQLRKMTPAMILGSGASLDKVSHLLSTWKGGIFCSSSQLSLLTYYKVKPTFVTIIDADPSMNYLIDQILKPETKYREIMPRYAEGTLVDYPVTSQNARKMSVEELRRKIS